LKKKIEKDRDNIVKELAVNILELNSYRTRTQQLDDQLKVLQNIKSSSSPRLVVGVDTSNDNIKVNFILKSSSNYLLLLF
jgi:hypothetical protein